MRFSPLLDDEKAEKLIFRAVEMTRKTWHGKMCFFEWETLVDQSPSSCEKRKRGGATRQKERRVA
jgi:hypothetical protein